MPAEVPEAEQFLLRLQDLQSDHELRKIQRYFKSGEGQYGARDRFIGVRMGHVFTLAKEFLQMPPAEIERLLESDIHEARAGAMSVMAKRYAHRATSDATRQELFELYLRRHDRINSWDLVDLAAWHVVGQHLLDRPRDVLYQLARSRSLWERRTAILATFAFIKRGEFEDTLAVAEILLRDREDLIHKAVGGMLRALGDKHRPQLLAFLDRHASTMPRTMLRYALEHIDEEQRAWYLGLKSSD